MEGGVGVERTTLWVRGGIGIRTEERGAEACKSREVRKAVILRGKGKDYK
jgi:hypothetical protein